MLFNKGDRVYAEGRGYGDVYSVIDSYSARYPVYVSFDYVPGGEGCGLCYRYTREGREDSPMEKQLEQVCSEDDGDNLMFADAQKGDRVYSLRKGWGEILSTNYSLDFPLLVGLDCSLVRTFTRDGKWSENDKSPELYWGKPEIIAPPAPERPVEADSRLWGALPDKITAVAKDADGLWFGYEGDPEVESDVWGGPRCIGLQGALRDDFFNDTQRTATRELSKLLKRKRRFVFRYIKAIAKSGLFHATFRKSELPDAVANELESMGFLVEDYGRITATRISWYPEHVEWVKGVVPWPDRGGRNDTGSTSQKEN